MALFFFFIFKQKASLWWDFFPARIPTGPLSQFLQKAVMKEEGSFEAFASSVLCETCLCFCSWLSEEVIFEPLIGM